MLYQTRTKIMYDKQNSCFSDAIFSNPFFTTAINTIIHLNLGLNKYY